MVLKYLSVRPPKKKFADGQIVQKHKKTFTGVSMVLEYLTVGKGCFFALTVKLSKAIETLVKTFWHHNMANGIATGFYLVRGGTLIGSGFPCSVSVLEMCIDVN